VILIEEYFIFSLLVLWYIVLTLGFIYVEQLVARLNASIELILELVIWYMIAELGYQGKTRFAKR
jgi:hypothetical protein